jgi:hypothetical protein
MDSRQEYCDLCKHVIDQLQLHSLIYLYYTLP